MDVSVRILLDLKLMYVRSKIRYSDGASTRNLKKNAEKIQNFEQ